jgi:UDP-GlcNAc3NAcA epimerase
MKIVSILGARPEFIRAGAMSRALRQHHQEIIVHTGQHYDANMSSIFFEELAIPDPDINLNVGSGKHGEQTGAMLTGIENILISEKPDWVIVHGDTNSTLAGALASAKLHVPVVHIEAGLRSFNRSMPEEINRIVTDHLATLLLCPSKAAVNNLSVEGIRSGVYIIGDLMADALFSAVKIAQTKSAILDQLNLDEKGYYLATVHRAENTDEPERLRSILQALLEIGKTIIFPVHPRTRIKISQLEGEWVTLLSRQNVKLIDPVGYLDMVRLEHDARMILTDSGGVQKEAYWLRVPCVTMRNETEWVETVEVGWNILTGAETQRIVETVRSFLAPVEHPPIYGDGNAALRCVAILEEVSFAGRSTSQSDFLINS